VRPDAWPDSRIAEVWDQFDQGTQRAVLRLVRSARGNNLAGSRAGEEEGGATGELGATGALGGANGHPAARSGRSLVLWGDRDPWYPPALAGAYAAVLGGASVERLPDAGHWPWLDRPDVVETVARFMED
jgi:pimeloyl-ACP methyl ester carboxylesterase